MNVSSYHVHKIFSLFQTSCSQKNNEIKKTISTKMYFKLFIFFCFQEKAKIDLMFRYKLHYYIVKLRLWLIYRKMWGALMDRHTVT